MSSQLPRVTRAGVSAIVVDYRSGAMLQRCLAALQDAASLLEVIVVDNSEDGCAQLADESASLPVRILRNPANTGFAGAVNLAAAEAIGDVLLILNPDTFVLPGCVDALYKDLESSPGVAGATLRVGAEKTLEVGATCDVSAMARGCPDDQPRPPLYVAGACLATTVDCFAAVGGMDERYFLFSEDLEYCWQALRRGFDVRITPRAFADHIGGASIAGGYSREGTVEVNASRVVLRERNATATLLACAPWQWLPLALCASLLRTTAFFFLLLSRRRFKAAAQVLVEVTRNVTWFHGTLRRRRRPGLTKDGEREAWRRVAHRLFLLDFLVHPQPLTLVASE